MAVVGDQFEHGGGGEAGGNGSGVEDGETGEESTAPELCGCTLSVRQNEDVLSVWNRRGEDQKVTMRIKYVTASLLCVVWVICPFDIYFLFAIVQRNDQEGSRPPSNDQNGV